MRILRSLLALPPSLLLLISSYDIFAQALDDGAEQSQREYVSTHRLKMRQVISDRMVGGLKPVAVRKMSEDGSEMFFPEYWGFEERDRNVRRFQESAIEDNQSSRLRREYIGEDEILRANTSAQCSFRPAFAIHESELNLLPDMREAKARHLGASRALAGLMKRGFQCPGGTSACLSISQPNYCCAAGEDCVSITDTGLGPVGCCPSGKTCTGEIKNCATDQTACPQNLGGACCVAGFSCFDVGCISSLVVTATNIITLPNPTPTPTTTFNPPTIATPSSSTPSITTTEAPLPPVRGTGDSVTASPTSLTSNPVCPTGFYACSAYYPGAGCCRIGRDCAQTFCPTTDSLTILSSGLTIAVPNVPHATTTAVGDRCASGWVGCSVEGGCCPSGWTCGPVSCVSAGPTGTQVVGKGAVGESNAMKVRGCLGVAGVLAVVVGILVG